MQTYRYSLDYAKISFLEDQTLFADDYADTYHAKGSAIAESEYVFIRGCKLKEKWLNRSLFTIAEFGFGSAINFLTTWKVWSSSEDRSKNLHYISFEKFPIRAQDLELILANYPELQPYGDLLTQQYAHLNYGYNRLTFGINAPVLTLFIGDVVDYLPKLNASVDAWYFDGFSPSKNPDMWSAELLALCKKNSHADTTFASFSAAGIFKDSLRRNMCSFTKDKGFGNKRDMLVGSLNGGREIINTKNLRIAIIGSGLAGSFMANSLAIRGQKSVVFESRAEIADRASGNPVGIFRPDFAKNPNFRFQFYHQAYLQMLRWLLFQQSNWGAFECRLDGAYRFISDMQLRKLYKNFTEDLQSLIYIKKLEIPELNICLQTEVSEPAFFLPFAGTLNPRKLCKFLLNNKLIDVRLNTPVFKIEVLKDGFVVNNENQISEFDLVILANAHESLQLLPELVDTISVNKGQLVYLNNSSFEIASNNKQALCYGAYLASKQDEYLVLGASYEHNTQSLAHVREEDLKLYNKTQRYFPKIMIDDTDRIGGRAEFRTNTADKLPIIEEKQRNLYLNLAHGSKGLHSALYAAEKLVGQILSGFRFT